uniref:RNA polymerase sigma factor n=1 Tax=Thermosporothrix sp. COM3 TaxID=2490863 RepID=A0A455SIT7_9CHLR|nr:hypothetical protein KTC_23870 [Thermosporothrix sp. COM3]
MTAFLQNDAYFFALEERIFVVNEQDSWTQWYEPLKRFTASKVQDPTAVDDILQDTFLKAYSHSASLRDPQKLRSWLYQITANTIADYYRKQQPLIEIEDITALEIEEPEHTSDLLQKAAADARNMLPLLPSLYREALELTDLRGMSQKELGEKLGISFSTARSRVQRARQMLKDLMRGCCLIVTDQYVDTPQARRAGILPSSSLLARRRSATTRSGRLSRSVRRDTLVGSRLPDGTL